MFSTNFSIPRSHTVLNIFTEKVKIVLFINISPLGKKNSVVRSLYVFFTLAHSSKIFGIVFGIKYLRSCHLCLQHDTTRRIFFYPIVCLCLFQDVFLYATILSAYSSSKHGNSLFSFLKSCVRNNLGYFYNQQVQFSMTLFTCYLEMFHKTCFQNSTCDMIC